MEIKTRLSAMYANSSISGESSSTSKIIEDMALFLVSTRPEELGDWVAQLKYYTGNDRALISIHDSLIDFLCGYAEPLFDHIAPLGCHWGQHEGSTGYGFWMWQSEFLGRIGICPELSMVTARCCNEDCTQIFSIVAPVVGDHLTRCPCCGWDQYIREGTDRIQTYVVAYKNPTGCYSYIMSDGRYIQYASRLDAYTHIDAINMTDMYLIPLIDDEPSTDGIKPLIDQGFVETYPELMTWRKIE